MYVLMKCCVLVGCWTDGCFFFQRWWSQSLGTNLGFLVMWIVSKHFGQLWVRSILGAYYCGTFGCIFKGKKPNCLKLILCVFWVLCVSPCVSVAMCFGRSSNHRELHGAIPFSLRARFHVLSHCTSTHSVYRLAFASGSSSLFEAQHLCPCSKIVCARALHIIVRHVRVHMSSIRARYLVHTWRFFFIFCQKFGSDCASVLY